MFQNCNKIFIFLIIFFLFPISSLAFPQFMEIYNKDKFTKPEKKNKCSVCHVSPNGGGPLNSFGKAFHDNNFKISSNLREQFPELFNLIQSVEPKITRVKPAMFIAGKNTTIILKGLNFTEGVNIRIDEEDVSDPLTSGIVFINSKTIKINVTFNDPGVHTIQVVNELGQSSNAFKVKVKAGKKR